MLPSLKYWFLCVFLGLSSFIQAQVAGEQETLSPKEYRQKKRALKDSARVYYWNLEKLDALLNARDEFQEENDSLKQAYQDLLAEISRLQDLEDEAQRLERENQQLKRDLAQKKQSPPVSPPPPQPKPEPTRKRGELPTKGIYFTVQVGAYTYDNYQFIARKAAGEEVITEKSGGLNKYLIGLFKDYDQAARLKNKLLNIGMPEAWVVAYRDGIRVPANSVRNLTGRN